MEMPVEDFFRAMETLHLERVARSSYLSMVNCIAQRHAISPRLAEPWVGRLTVAAMAWHMGVPREGIDGREKHPQGRQVRKALRGAIDHGWSATLEAHGPEIEEPAIKVFASLPLPLRASIATIESVLSRVGEGLDHVPFAVFYALLTDARKGGRVWQPPAGYLDARGFDRSAYDTSVGNRLESTRSRRRRYVRPATLSEFGLSAVYPRTVAKIDRWLESERPAPLCIGSKDEPALAWHEYLTGALDEIERQHARLVERFTVTYRSTRDT
jgi:hypothetical protein